MFPHRIKISTTFLERTRDESIINRRHRHYQLSLFPTGGRSRDRVDPAEPRREESTGARRGGEEIINLYDADPARQVVDRDFDEILDRIIDAYSQALHLNSG